MREATGEPRQRAYLHPSVRGTDGDVVPPQVEGRRPTPFDLHGLTRDGGGQDRDDGPNGRGTRYTGRVFAEARCIWMRGGGLLNVGTLAVSAAIAAARSAAVKAPVVRQNSTRFSLGSLV